VRLAIWVAESPVTPVADRLTNWSVVSAANAAGVSPEMAGQGADLFVGQGEELRRAERCDLRRGEAGDPGRR
jgi:hypothetical protein